MLSLSPHKAGVRPPHLTFLDGMRGLAALYVVIFHSYMLVYSHQRMGWRSTIQGHFTNWMGYGHLSVDVFIVLSGFVLMLPVARSGDLQLRGGIRRFGVRRFRRIYPPYVAALLLATVVAILGANMHLMHHDGASLSGFLAHVFMVHNWDSAWVFQIDGPMWSVATECDIYIIFALLLLPLWRQYGIAATVLVAAAMSLAPHLFLPASRNLDWACPWFVGLFAFGMWGAVVCFKTGRAAPASTTQLRCWGVAAGFGAGLIWLLTIIFPADTLHGVISGLDLAWVDILVGLTTMAFIVYCVRRSAVSGTLPLWAHLFSHPGAVMLGTFSYSLYLIHMVLLQGLVVGLGSRLSGMPELMTVMACLPLVAGFSYIFYRFFERPFMMTSDVRPVPPTPELRDPNAAAS